MIRNYIKTAFRSIMKNRVMTSVNIIGLTLGITCSLVLYTLINYWLSFNKHESNYDSVYRLVHSWSFQGNELLTPGIPTVLPNAFREDFPEVEESTFLSYLMNPVIGINPGQVEETIFQSSGVAFVEPSYFNLFDRKILMGSSPETFREPNRVYISTSLVDKYYSGKDVLGERITVNGDMELEVVGVIEDHLETSDFKFEMLISYQTVKSQYEEYGWYSISSDDQFYVKSKNPEVLASIENRFSDFLEKHADNNYGVNRYYFQPLSDIHYNTAFNSFFGDLVAKQNIWALGFVAIFLIVIASINYVNLATAHAIKRAKEVGIRKVMGSSRKQLVFQVFGEAFLIVLCSIMISLGFAEISLTWLNSFMDIELSLAFEEVRFILFLLGIFFTVSLLSGIYPALVVSGYNPIKALKTDILEKTSKKKLTLRHSLVLVQFFVAQAFITGTMIVYFQTQYLNNKDLGFNKESVVAMSTPSGEPDEKRKLFRNKLARLSGIEGATLMSTNPTSSSISESNYSLDGGDDEETVTDVKRIDHNYLDVFDIPILVGDNLPESDTVRGYLVNEAFARREQTTSEELIGLPLELNGLEAPIVGVVKDFHTRNLRQEIKPLVMSSRLEHQQRISAKISALDMEQMLAQIETTWGTVYPDYPFDYQFLDEYIANFYRSERRLSKIISIFSLVAIGISCLGLFGLVTFISNQKVKEVGIRKVLGASIGSIMILFNKEFVKLIFIAFAIAVPIVWFFMKEWLSQFSYKIEMSPWLFALGFISTLILAFVTVSYQSLRAAIANPVKSLRNE
ncbi:MAG: FtsX-like permease family protein [Bacteroidota bacterium]